MLSQEMTVVLARIDKFSTDVGGEVSAVATRLNAIVAKIGTGGLSADEAASVTTQLSADADKLEAAGVALTSLASDPANPTPVVTPVTEPAPAASATPAPAPTPEAAP